MRVRWLAAVAAVFAVGGAAAAQPANDGPTLEVRLKSVNELINKAEYVAGLAGQEDKVQQVREILKALSADGKGIEGIDPKQPFGLTATLTAGVIDSPILVMIPIADRDRFLGMLKDRLQLTPEKADDDTLKTAFPYINEVYMRFANDYVYVGRSVKSLDPKTLPKPKDYFAKDDGSVGSVVVHLDRIPAELKTFVVGQMTIGIAEQRKRNGEKENPAQKAILDWATENGVSAVQSFLDDAKMLTARVFVDEKSDDLSAEVTLTAKPGSTLAKNIADLAGKSSLPAGIVGAAKGAAVHATVKAGLPEGVKKDLGKVVDAAIAEILKDVPEGERAIAEKVLKVIAPTLKAGEIDAAVSFHGPDAKGRHTLVAAVGVTKGKDVEKLVKDLWKEYGAAAGGAVTVDFDVAKVGAFNLHTVTVADLPAELEAVFGAAKIWLATSEDHIALSIETDGSALKAGLAAKAVPVPVASVDVAFAKLVPVIGQKLQPDEIKAILKDAFGGPPAGKDTLAVTVTGGTQLTVKGKLKGAGVRLIANIVMGAAK